MILFHAEISQDRSVDLLFPGILHPHLKICLDIHPPHTIQCYNIKLPDRFIIFRRISCCRDQPSFRHTVASEGLVLKELQHGRRKCLGDTVDLIDKQDSLLLSGTFHTIIHRSNDLA